VTGCVKHGSSTLKWGSAGRTSESKLGSIKRKERLLILGRESAGASFAKEGIREQQQHGRRKKPRGERKERKSPVFLRISI